MGRRANDLDPDLWGSIVTGLQPRHRALVTAVVRTPHTDALVADEAERAHRGAWGGEEFDAVFPAPIPAPYIHTGFEAGAL
jgi:hypothetical protein